MKTSSVQGCLGEEKKKKKTREVEKGRRGRGEHALGARTSMRRSKESPSSPQVAKREEEVAWQQRDKKEEQ